MLADAVRIREILVNILSNAVKFTDDGGSITFETGFRPGEDDQHIVVCYRISDTGVGMSEEFAENIFEEFAQEESGIRTQYKGTGLGMAITKRYVDLMGGTISVESKKGEGSVFTVELPLELTDESRVPRQELPAAETDLTGVRILLAEDNDLNAEIAMVQMEELGIQVTRASDGSEAVKAFTSSSPDTFDLILMDIMMPRMNGYEAAKAIRAAEGRPDGRTIPIIGYTALAASHLDNADMIRAYLSKISVSSSHLLTLINDVLDMSRIERGRVKIEEKEVHLPDVLHDLRTIIQSNIAAKQQDLYIDTQDILHEDIITDKLRLNQVLLNIVSNAIKFTPVGGTISIRVLEKACALSGYATYEFRIKDNGIGMSGGISEAYF